MPQEPQHDPPDPGRTLPGAHLPVPPVPPAASDHAVQFYEHEDGLVAAAVRFIGDGLRRGERVLVFATAAHAAAIRAALGAEGLDAGGAGRQGRLVCHDARRTLARVLRGGLPDPARFQQEIGATVRRHLAEAGGAGVRAFGEMVDVLWSDGDREAALRLETLWHELAEAHRFTLLCAYAMGHFDGESQEGLFQQVVARHTRVLPDDRYASAAAAPDHLRSLADLQRRARSLESEIARRSQLEGALRAALAEQVRAEGALRESEERYRRLVALLPAAVYTCDADGRITFYNEKARELWGRAPAPGDPHERFCGSQRLWRADGTPLPHAQTPMALALSDGTSFRNQDVVIERPDGSRLTVLVTIDPIRDAAGRVTGAINVFHDTTALRLAQDELRRSEEHLRAVVETTPGCIKIVGPDLGLRQLNAGGLALFEAQRPEEVIGRPMDELVAPEDRDAYRAFHDRICAGGRGTFEYTIVGLRGTRRRVETHAAPLTGADGRFLHLAITHDVTQRTQADESLRRHAGRLRLLWEAASVLLTSDDPDAMLRGLFAKIGPSLGLDVYFDHVAIEARGTFRLVSSAGLRDEDLRVLARDDAGGDLCGAAARDRRPLVVSGIQRTADPAARLPRELGLRAYACLPLTTGGRLLGTLSFGSRTRDELGQDDVEFLQTISQYVSAAYERLGLIERLREQDRRKDAFLATLAHELRNPLAPIRSGVELIRRAGRDPGVIEQACPMMERQLRHMVRLVDDLLDVSRISRDRLELRREPTDLGAVVDSALETCGPVLAEAGHALTVSLPRGPVPLDADRVRLAQAFANLLNNAAKYTEPGGRIWLTAAVEDAGNGGPPMVAVRVRDTGVGIAPGTLPHIFDLFVQADTRLERTQGGLGIGLTLAQRLIRMHGGTLSAASEGPGRGSEFTVRLPVAARVPAGGDAAVAGAAPAGAGAPAAVRRRILVADDNGDSAEMLAALLGFLGHEVVVAHDGHEAIEQAERVRPDIAFLDLGMPRVSGYDAARRIRAIPGGERMRLVAMTGWGQDEDKRRSREAGFDAHLVKPVDVAAIEALLE